MHAYSELSLGRSQGYNFQTLEDFDHLLKGFRISYCPIHSGDYVWEIVFLLYLIPGFYLYCVFYLSGKLIVSKKKSRGDLEHERLEIE